MQLQPNLGAYHESIPHQSTYDHEANPIWWNRRAIDWMRNTRILFLPTPSSCRWIWILKNLTIPSMVLVLSTFQEIKHTLEGWNCLTIAGSSRRLDLPDGWTFWAITQGQSLLLSTVGPSFVSDLFVLLILLCWKAKLSFKSCSMIHCFSSGEKVCFISGSGFQMSQHPSHLYQVMASRCFTLTTIWRVYSMNFNDGRRTLRLSFGIVSCMLPGRNVDSVSQT